MIISLGVAVAGGEHRQMTRHEAVGALSELADTADTKSDNLTACGDDRPRREDVGLDGGALGGLGDRPDWRDGHRSLLWVAADTGARRARPRRSRRLSRASGERAVRP